MEKRTDIRKGRNVFFDFSAKFVFVTKMKEDVFTDDALKTINQSMLKVCEKYECVITEFTGSESHVGIKIEYDMKTDLVKLVNSLKTVSSRMVRKEHEYIKDKLYHNSLWSKSYLAFSEPSKLKSEVGNFITEYSH